jgi:hypothetical protein
VPEKVPQSITTVRVRLLQLVCQGVWPLRSGRATGSLQVLAGVKVNACQQIALDVMLDKFCGRKRLP